METISRRLGVSIRLDIDKIEELEELARMDNVRPTKKAETIVLEYLEAHPVNEHPSGE